MWAKNIYTLRLNGRTIGNLVLFQEQIFYHTCKIRFKYVTLRNVKLKP